MVYAWKNMIFVLIVVFLWILSEVSIAKDIKRKNNNETVWLLVNILLPFVGCLLYHVNHKTIKE